MDRLPLKHVCSIGIVLLLFVAAVFVWPRGQGGGSLVDASSLPPSSEAGDVLADSTPGTGLESVSVGSKPQTSSASAIAPMNPLSHQKVFRFILEEGTCTMDVVEQVVGDFRPRRGPSELHPGMIVCRLLGERGEVLAEETVHPPDHVCAVHDPNVSADAPALSLLAGLGPQVFQVRFPDSLAGRTIEIHRVMRTDPDLDQTLLLTLPIEK